MSINQTQTILVPQHHHEQESNYAKQFTQPFSTETFKILHCSHTHHCKNLSCFRHLPKCLPIAFVIIYEVARSAEMSLKLEKSVSCSPYHNNNNPCRGGRVSHSFQNLLTNPCDVGSFSLKIILVCVYDDITVIIKTTKATEKTTI